MVAHALITRSGLLTQERSTGIICSIAGDAHRHERYSALASGCPLFGSNIHAIYYNEVGHIN